MFLYWYKGLLRKYMHDEAWDLQLVVIHEQREYILFDNELVEWIEQSSTDCKTIMNQSDSYYKTNCYKF